MVRLKVIFYKCSFTSTCISIPYGAIKRGGNECFIILSKYISIPYGAIKSVKNLFTFLR